MATQRVANLQFPGLTNRELPYISPHLRVGMSIYPIPFLEDIPFIPKRGNTARKIDWDGQSTEASVIAFQWDKQLGQPAGSWSATIKASASGKGISFDDQEITDGDWVDIAILRNGIRIPLCRGLVDSVRKRTVSADGATVAIYSVSGRDHGAFFEYPITWNNLWARTLSEIVAGFATKKLDGRIGGRPDELFAAIIESWFKGTARGGAKSGQWILPQSLEDISGKGDSKLFDLLEVVTFNSEKGGRGLRGAYYNEPQLWTIGEQTLHQTLTQWTNPILNEFWYDLLPPDSFMPKNSLSSFLGASQVFKGKLPTSTDELFVDDSGIGIAQSVTSDDKDFGTIAAIIRERPFPNTILKRDSMWFGLPTWTIPTWLIEESDLGRGGQQRFNLFDIMADFGLGSQQEQAAFAQPRWHKAGLFTHGLRTYQAHTRFFAQNRGGPGDWFEERKKWIKLLVDWFAPSPYLLQGTIRVKTILPEIRIGHRVIIDNGDPNQRIQLYVEGVNLVFAGPTQAAGSGGSTTLIVTRGFKGSDDELMDATTKLSDLFQEVF